MASRTSVISIALSLLSLTGSPCRAQNASVPAPPSASSTVPATACKTPAKLSAAAGFTLACGKRIPTGIFLGSVISPAADSIGDCAARCTANAKCLAFSLDNRDAPATRVCTLLGSIESSTDATGWVTGVRVTSRLVSSSKTKIDTIDLDLARGRAATKPPTAALEPTIDHSYIRHPGKIPGSSDATDAGSVVSDDRSGTHPLSGYFAGYRTSLHHKAASDIIAKPYITDEPSIAASANTADPEKPATSDLSFAATSDMDAVQPVYFTTDRTVTGGALQEASFTDTPSMAVTYGYAVVSIPKSHTFGNIERPHWSWLKFSTPPATDATDFRIQVLNALEHDAFVSQLKADKDSVMLFIHGYNVTFSDALFKAAQIAYDANFGGSVLVFSWPSAGDPLKYDKDRDSAESAVPHLLQLFHLVTEEIGKKNVYIVAHSMGNQILVNALQQAALSRANVTISELVMAAPDVDINVFRSKADQIRAVAKNITLYASSADKALRASGDKSFGTRLGFVGPAGPNIFPGIETIDVTAVGDDMFGLNHSTFSNSRAVLEDLGHLIRSLTHIEPDARTPTLKFRPDKAHLQYWLYPP